MSTPSIPSSQKTEDLVKIAYDAEFDRKERLDDKANSLMSTASTVASLFGGFGLAVSTSLFQHNLQLNWPIVTLIFGVSALIGCIFFSAWATLLRNYNYAGNFNKYIKEVISDSNFVYDNKNIDMDMNRDPMEFNKLMIKRYSRFTYLNYCINQKRSRSLSAGQISFFIGILTVPIFIILLVIPNMPS